jgi:DNA-binding NarL/FixJ family response regulator
MRLVINEDAMKAIRSVQTAVMLNDLGLPGMSGVELIGAFVPGRVTKFPKIRWDYRIPAASMRLAYQRVEVLHSPVAV